MSIRPSTDVPTTRLAPSPTGALHLGNARTFLINWALARQRGWRVWLRIEDLDTPRVKPGADVQAIEDLRWLGLDWDTSRPPLYQRADLAPYKDALAELAAGGLLYPCRCTRTEIERASSAPHGDEHERRYPGTCRPEHRGVLTGCPRDAPPLPPSTAAPSGAALPQPGSADAPAWRVIVPDEPVSFIDQVRGPQSFNVQQEVGDFVVATKSNLPAYQLAVVVDDARQGVTDVVRGDDLLPSTARQIILYRYLRLTPLPRYWHLPLIRGSDGRRLAKRHGDTRLAEYRRRGVPAERIIGLLAQWSGLPAAPAPLTAAEFADRFVLERLPLQAVTFTPEHHRWLLEGR